MKWIDFKTHLITRVAGKWLWGTALVELAINWRYDHIVGRAPGGAMHFGPMQILFLIAMLFQLLLGLLLDDFTQDIRE